MLRKGQVWISAVIYVLIIVVTLVIVLSVAQPLLNKMRDKAAFEDSKQQMLSLDKHITEVASEGPGSQRVVPVDFSDGKIVLTNGSLEYVLETDSEVISPGANSRVGNLLIGSGFDVSASESNESFILENSRIKAIFNNTNNLTSTESIIKSIVLKENNESVAGFGFDFNGTACSAGSNISINEIGTGLASASVNAHIVQSGKVYDLVFTLDSEADFLKVEVR